MAMGCIHYQRIDPGLNKASALSAIRLLLRQPLPKATWLSLAASGYFLAFLISLVVIKPLSRNLLSTKGSFSTLCLCKIAELLQGSPHRSGSDSLCHHISMGCSWLSSKPGRDLSISLPAPILSNRTPEIDTAMIAKASFTKW